MQHPSLIRTRSQHFVSSPRKLALPLKTKTRNGTTAPSHVSKKRKVNVPALGLSRSVNLVEDSGGEEDIHSELGIHDKQKAKGKGKAKVQADVELGEMTEVDEAEGEEYESSPRKRKRREGEGGASSQSTTGSGGSSSWIELDEEEEEPEFIADSKSWSVCN
jgi:hypothetical protein